MREMRTTSTTFRFIKKRKKRRKKRIESEERFLLDSSKTLASRTLNFLMPHLLTQQRQFMEMQVEVRGVRITVDASSDNVLLSENDRLPLTA